MTDITALARRCAEAAARVEMLISMGPGGDPEENREMAIAISRARAKHQGAAAALQEATPATEQAHG